MFGTEIELSPHAHVCADGAAIVGWAARDQAYLARLTGPDHVRGVARTFLRADRSVPGEVVWSTTVDGVYEFGKFTTHAARTATAWFVRPAGKVCEVDRAVAFQLVAAAVAARPPRRVLEL